MTNTERAWLILANAYLPRSELDALIGKYGSAEEIVARAAGELPAEARARIVSPDKALLDATERWLAGDNRHLVCRGAADYPELLAEIPGPPLLLYVSGDPDALHLPSLAIVGSRNPSRSGIENALRFARHLGGSGFCIVSGLAQGIDAAAHEGALEAAGRTVAFLGHGIDRVYPAANHKLAHRIAKGGGALVSEYPLGSPPRREHFPARNRLISGLCCGTLVVEAARRSGSLITARLASEQGREVFAIPGSIHNPLARGCHRLIREGAKLVESAADIVDELGPIAGHLMQNAAEESGQAPAIEDPDYRKLLDVVGFDPVTADIIAERSGLTIGQVSSILLILELEGIIEAHSGGRYSMLGEK